MMMENNSREDEKEIRATVFVKFEREKFLFLLNKKMALGFGLKF